MARWAGRFEVHVIGHIGDDGPRPTETLRYQVWWWGYHWPEAQVHAELSFESMQVADRAAAILRAELPKTKSPFEVDADYLADVVLRSV